MRHFAADILLGGLTILEIFFLTSPLLSLACPPSAHSCVYFEGAAGHRRSDSVGHFLHRSLRHFICDHPPRFFWCAWSSSTSLPRDHDGGLERVFAGLPEETYFKLHQPEADPVGAGYQVIQSKVAIGSGILRARATSRYADQAVVSSRAAYGLYFLGPGRTIRALRLHGGAYLVSAADYSRVYHHAVRKEQFSNLVIVGSVSLLAFHIFINVSMTVGMMPVWACRCRF